MSTVYSGKTESKNKQTNKENKKHQSEEKIKDKNIKAFWPFNTRFF